MPARDGTGPQGKGPRTGRGAGRCGNRDEESNPISEYGQRGGGGAMRRQGKGRGSGQGQNQGNSGGMRPGRQGRQSQGRGR